MQVLSESYVHNARICAEPTCAQRDTSQRCPCGGAMYCGAECQLKHWSSHRDQCTIHLTKRVADMRLEYGNDSMRVCAAEFEKGLVLQAQAKYAACQECFIEAVRITIAVYGPDHPSVAPALVALLESFTKEGRFAKGMGIGAEALRIYTLNEDDAGIASCHGLMGVIDSREDRLSEATSKYTESLRLFRKIYAHEDHIDVAKVLGNLASCHRRSQCPVLAQECIDESIAMIRRLCAPDAPDTESFATSLILLSDLTMHNASLNGDTCYMVGSESSSPFLLKSMGYLEDAILILRLIYGDKHPHVSAVRVRIASNYMSLGRFVESHKILKKTLKYQIRFLGPIHEVVAATMNSISLIYMANGDNGKALEVLEEVANIFRTVYADSNHVATKQVDFNIAQCKARLQRGPDNPSDNLIEFKFTN
jgi:tetratricopeptide (TPR) repeat protein